jgi:signal transduction histidine kinase
VGLRARSSLSFGLGALLVASTMAGLTFVLARAYLLQQREESAVRQSYVNARLVRDVLGDPTTDVSALLNSLHPNGNADVAVRVGSQWYSTSVAVGEEAIPRSLRSIVEDGGAGRQRVDLGGEATLVSAVALPAVDAAYYELFPLDELGSTLDTLRVVLSISAGVAAVAGAAVGLLASRRVLRPLREVAATATDIADGSLDLRLDVHRDVDLKPLTDAFNAMVDGLQERIRREARFSSDVSHELRSPLAAIAAAMAVAERRRPGMSPEIREVVDILGSQIDTFEALTLDLLEISRVDAGAVSLALEPVDASTFAHRFAETLPEPIEVDAPADAGTFLADKRRLRQVLDNLVSNAARYAGGADRIAVSRSDGRIRITVEDRGRGVPEHERESIFGRFARGQAAAAHPEAKGSGLGLALAREHVELHGGWLTVEDRPGGGARFVIDLPEADPTDLSHDVDGRWS